MLKKINIHNLQLPSGNAPSRRMFVALSVLTMVVFMLFWFVGYDTPYTEDSNFVAPLFTNVLLVFMVLVVVLAIGTTVWSMVRALSTRGKGERTVNNIPVKKITYGVAVLTAILLLVTLALGSSDAMMVNGEEYADKWWLHVADMFVNSSLALVVVAVVAIIVFTIKNSRRR